MHSQRRRADYSSVESTSAMNNRNLRDNNMRGSAKNLQETGQGLRDSGSLEAAMNGFSIKKTKRVNGVQLAPLNHPISLKSGVDILSQGRPSIPQSARHAEQGKQDKLSSAELSSMALLQKEMLNA